MKLPFPACGGEVSFKSRSSVFAVCSYCTSMVVRTDKNLEAIGKMAELPPDMTPFQIGTSGKFQKKHFEIIGRQKLFYDNGSWNEWYVMFDTGESGWLGEAQGFLSISFAVPDVEIQDTNLKPGMAVPLNGKSFQVDDIKKIVSEGSSGELPVMGEKGREITSIDLTGAGKSFANIVFQDKHKFVFVGSYVDFDELAFSNLREIDGW